jgi:hypothetical protein
MLACCSSMMAFMCCTFFALAASAGRIRIRGRLESSAGRTVSTIAKACGMNRLCPNSFIASS